MALRALHVWKLNSKGEPMIDRNGHKIPHKKMGMAKTYKELSPAEREQFDDSIKQYNDAKNARAANLLGEFVDAKDTLSKAS